MVKLYDISRPLNDFMPIYPGDPVFRRSLASSFDGGKSCEVGLIEMGCHNGTHVDFPAHIIKGGKRIGDFPLNVFVGPVKVIDLSDLNEHIAVSHLKPIEWKNVSRILFKTRNSLMADRLTKFDENFIALTKEAASFLAEMKVRLVGVDGPSVDRFKSGDHPAHTVLVKDDVVLLEGLDLNGVDAGEYTLVSAPLKISNAEGAPVRAILIDEQIC